MEYKCNYCDKILKTKSSLNNHIKTAKYCLIKQGKHKEEFKCEICNKILSSKQRLKIHSDKCGNKSVKIIIFDCKNCGNILSSKQMLEKHYKKCIEKEKVFECEYCDEILSNKNNLIIHQASCAKKFEFILEKKDKENKELVNKLERICNKAIEKPTITNNNNIINTKYAYLSNINLDPKYIKETIDKKFTKDHFLDGQYGVADFTYNNLLKNEDNKQIYACGDPSRGVFYYKENDSIVKDYKANRLRNSIYSDIVEKSKKIQTGNQIKDKDAQEFAAKCISDIKNLKSDSGRYICALAAFISGKINKESLIAEIQSDGETEYYYETDKESITESEIKFYSCMNDLLDNGSLTSKT